MTAIATWVEANTNNALAGSNVVHKIKKVFCRVIRKLSAKRDRGAAADNEKLASVIAHVPGTGSVNFRVHAADAVKAVRHPQMAHGLSCKLARCSALQDDACHRIGVVILGILSGLTGKQDRVRGGIHWYLRAR